MRWGILANLAVILTVSGLLLFVVFSASLERSAIDGKLQEAGIIADLIESRLLGARTSQEMWAVVRQICRRGTGPKLLLFDEAGEVLGGCSVHKGAPPRAEWPDHNRRIRVEGATWSWPTRLFKGMTVVVDITGPFLQGVKSARIFLQISPSVFSPAWKFFAGYLVLTQASLFFLGYILFHRTVVGPVGEIARLAGKAAGMTDVLGLPDSMRFRGDIQKISSSLKSVMIKIVDDRDKMETLIAQLRKTNTELEAAQQGLVRSEKMAGVGRLAAGLAHEIGNPLQIVMGYSEILQRAPSGETRTEILGRMDQELKRIHEILQRLLEFARPARRNPVVCDLNELMRSSGALIEGRKGFRNIEMVYEPDDRLVPFETEPEKIRQIVVNLIFNAVDAIPESGGTVTLRTKRLGPAVEIEVEDTGHGIPEEDLGKVFDPFFTTKEPGKGTGLGLAVCLGLAESLGGSIDIRSEANRGTVVKVTLPLPGGEVGNEGRSNVEG